VKLRRKWSGNGKTVLGTVQANVACDLSFPIIHRFVDGSTRLGEKNRFDSNPNQTITVFSTDRININVITLDRYYVRNLYVPPCHPLGLFVSSVQCVDFWALVFGSTRGVFGRALLA
jgi:hypothetical protein